MSASLTTAVHRPGRSAGRPGDIRNYWLMLVGFEQGMVECRGSNHTSYCNAWTSTMSATTAAVRPRTLRQGKLRILTADTSTVVVDCTSCLSFVMLSPGKPGEITELRNGRGRVIENGQTLEKVRKICALRVCDAVTVIVFVDISSFVESVFSVSLFRL